MTPEREQELRVRLAELDAADAEATGWGAAVGARHEERQEIQRELRAATSPRIVRDPDKAALLAELHSCRAILERIEQRLIAGVGA